MLGVILISRLYAMYQGSRKMLIFLIVTFLVVNIACVVINAIGMKYYVVADELILSGTSACTYNDEGIGGLLIIMVWMLTTAWEVLALCLAVRISVQHIRNLQRLGRSTGPGSSLRDCFTVLIESHVLYFASFAAVSCLQIGLMSPSVDPGSMGFQIYAGILQIFMVMQMFVLGPNLILSVREYNAKLVVDSDIGTNMTSIAFQERVHVSTSNTV
ncbi:hypothetical protein EV702DRAFT_1277492 [Suillus placidus]|uniref:Uncharacterized protein n=1 Tax=Suillus placidus TaxID=48579 RepID=A0A9P6ZZ49_9AGAM|nr:hypothetical protein EV702DRAFT_1277492 [Suillus placidus]